MPLVFALDPIVGLTDIHAVTPGVAGSGSSDYSGLSPVDGVTAVSVRVPNARLLVLDPVDGITVVGYRIAPDLDDAPPISMGFFARAHAILLPPVDLG